MTELHIRHQARGSSRYYPVGVSSAELIEQGGRLAVFEVPESMGAQPGDVLTMRGVCWVLQAQMQSGQWRAVRMLSRTRKRRLGWLPVS